jgi:hypothetical protein
MIVVGDLRARKLVRAWQEAVAIVQELTDTLARAGHVVEVPDLEHVAAGPNGELVILPGTQAGGQPVQQLAQALEALIDGTAAPPELRRIVAENTCDPPRCTSVEEFSQALVIFERPGRRGDIAGVVARDPSAEAQAQLTLDSELERLRARARQAVEARAKEDASQLRARARRGSWIVPVAASVLVLVGAATLAALQSDQQRRGALSGLRTLVSHAGDRLVRIVRSGMDAIIPSRETEEATGLNVSPEPRATSVPAPAAEPLAAAGPSDSAALDFAPTPSRGNDQSASEPPPTPNPQQLIESRAAERASGPVEGLDRAAVYKAADAEVVPPVMLRQYLPRAALDGATDAATVLEFVISEIGTVEHVRLIPGTSRFQDRMLVSAAKTWRFRPALRDGRPVKYRLRVGISL